MAFLGIKNHPFLAAHLWQPIFSNEGSYVEPMILGETFWKTKTPEIHAHTHFLLYIIKCNLFLL